VPNLVRHEHLLNAIVLYSFLGNGSSVVGPALFAPMVKLAGLEGLFFFVGTAYALTVVMLLIMKPMPSTRGDEKGRLWDDLRDGLAYIGAHPRIVGLIAIAVVTGLFGAFGTLLPVFAEKIGGGGVEGYGNLLLSSGVGGLAGFVALLVFGNMKNSVSLQLLSGVGFGLGIAVFSQMSWLPASLGFIGVVGACSTAFGTINNTLVQSMVDDRFRGRVMSIHQLGWGASALGGLLMGSLAEAFDPPFALTLGGIVIAVATVVLTLSVTVGGAGRDGLAGLRGAGEADAASGR
jgi:multisubunit Na+/H+ antiporter MnhC subunit